MSDRDWNRICREIAEKLEPEPTLSPMFYEELGGVFEHDSLGGMWHFDPEDDPQVSHRRFNEDARAALALVNVLFAKGTEFSSYRERDAEWVSEFYDDDKRPFYFYGKAETFEESVTLAAAKYLGIET